MTENLLPVLHSFMIDPVSLSAKRVAGARASHFLDMRNERGPLLESVDCSLYSCFIGSAIGKTILSLLFSLWLLVFDHSIHRNNDVDR
jgi:hypothetical protein